MRVSRTNTAVGREIVGVLLCVALFLCSIAVYLPITPRGVQCPTAPIQSIVVVSTKLDCCGNLVVSETVRTPREGEIGFKQCRCSEKKAAQTQSESNSETQRPSLLALVTPAFVFEPARLDMPSTLISVPDNGILSSAAAVPLTPPPQSI